MSNLRSHRTGAAAHVSVPSAPTLPEALAVIHRWAAVNGIVLTGITLEQSDGKALSFTLAPMLMALPAPATATTAKRHITRHVTRHVTPAMLRAVYRALPAADAPPITFQTIKNGTRYDRASIYRCLRR